MGSKQIRARDANMVAMSRIIWLWPAHRVIISIQTIRPHENSTSVAKRRMWDITLIGRRNEVISIKEEGPDFAICNAKGCYENFLVESRQCKYITYCRGS
jgi:hypothetical protein